MSNKEITSIEGTVFNIQKYSVHDGPGIRTVVFLKGCPLACKWCSNPESQRFNPEIVYNEKKCITLSECARCVEFCTAGALITGDNDKIEVVWDSCNDCLACTDVCPAEALVPCGEVQNVKAVIDQVEKDACFYARSGGGLTLGGGEPLAQPTFAIALLKEAKHRYMKSAIETCGYAEKEDILEACKYCNIIMFDIKSMDSAKHKEFTGRGNERILENLIAIRETYPKLKIRVRTPIIPGFNDTEEDIQAIVDFIKDKNVEYELLPYHRLGTQKYINIGRDYPLGHITLDDNKLSNIRKIAQQNDVKG